MFWKLADESGLDVADRPGVRVAALEFPKRKTRATHRAPTDEPFVCIAGTPRFTREETERDLPGYGIAIREGRVHTVTGMSPGRAIACLRQNGNRA